MRPLQVISPHNLYAFAQDKGLLANPDAPAPKQHVHLVPAAEVLDHEGKLTRLAPFELTTADSFQLRIPNALVWPANLGIVHGDHLLPGGFYHQSIWATDSAGGNNLSGRVQLPDWPEMTAPMEAVQLMGFSSHWGHFFTDTLDRLFAIADAGEWHIPLITDAAGPCDNGMQLMMLAEIVNAAIEIWPLKARALYRFKELRVNSLTSLKPAAPVENLLRLRDAVFSRLRLEGNRDRSPLFVGRKQVKLRRLAGQDELNHALSHKEIARVIYPETLSIRENIENFHRHETVVLPIGSAKFNLPFCRPGTQVICITPRGYAENNGAVCQLLRHMCGALELQLGFYACQSVAGEGSRAHMLLHDDLMISEQDVVKLLTHFVRHQ